MNKIEDEFRKQLGPEFDHSGKPTVYFFDHAVPIESDHRPRFKCLVYISKTSKSSLGTQEFHAKASEQDKHDYPQQWQHYLAVKDNLSKPRVGLLPGIDEGVMAEMKAIGIHNLEQLLEQDEFPEWQQQARRIYDAISEKGSEGRDRIPGNEIGSFERVLAEDRAGQGGGQNRTQGCKEKTSQKAGFQESHPQEITFDFGMTL